MILSIVRLSRRALNLLALAAFIGLSGSASAQNVYVWNGSGTSWETPGSWTPSGPPSLTTDVAQFDNTSTANLSTTIGTNYSIGQIVIGTMSTGSPSAPVSIGGTNTLTLNVNSGFGAGIDMSQSTANLTINAPLVVASSSPAQQTWNVAAGTTLTVGTVSMSSSASTGLQFPGAGNISTGAVTIAASSTSFTNNGSGTVTIASIGGTASTLNFDGTGTGTVNVTGTIGPSTGTLSKSSSGILTLSGANTFTGGVTLNNGTLNINSASALGTTAGFFTINGGTIDNTFGPTFTTTNNYIQKWQNSFAFTGTNNLSLGTGAVGLVGTNTVTVNANTLTVGGIIGGAYGLIVNGAGTLVLSGVNTFNGGLTINGNVSFAGPDTNLGAAGVTFGNGGTLSYTSTSATALTLTASRIITVPMGVSATLATAGTGGMTTNGKITASTAGILTGGGTLTKTGAGDLQITAAQTLSGTFIIAGGVEASLSAALGTAAVQIQNGGELAVSTNAALPNSFTITANGTGTGPITSPIGGNAGSISGSVAVNGPWTIALRDFNTPANGRNFTVSGPLSGSGGITISGPTTPNGQTFSLTGNNSGYSGTITVGAGLNVSFGQSSSTGSTTPSISSSTTALEGIGYSYDFGATVPAFNNFLTGGATTGGVFGINTVLASTTTLNLSILGNGNGTMFLGSQTTGTYSATTLTPSGTTYRLGGGGGTLTISAAALADNGSATSLVVGDSRTDGNGTVVLSGANTFTGSVTVAGGTSLSVSSINSVSGGTAGSSLGAPSSVANGTIHLGSTTATGTLVYTGTAYTTDRVIDLAGTTGGGTLDQSGTGLLKFTSAFTASVAGAKTLTLQGSTSGTGLISGAIVNSSSGATSLIKTGSGTWTLAGANTYTGLTTVTGGTLIIAGGSTMTSGFTLTTGTNPTLIANTTSLGTGIIDLATPVTTPFLEFHINGGGTITNQLAGNSTVTDTIDVNNNGNGSTGGVINMSSPNSGLGTDVLNVTGGNGYSLTIAHLGNTATTPGTMMFVPTTATLSLGSLTGTQALSATNIWDLDGTAQGNSVTGVISNGGSAGLISAVTKSNTSTWTLSGNNTYTGTTTVSGGTLIIAGSTGSLPASSPLTFAGPGTLNYQFKATGSTQALGVLTQSAGDGTLIATNNGGTDTLTFSSLGTRVAGATLNLVYSGGVIGSTSLINITGATGFQNQGLFVNGADYAYATGTYLRAPNYGTDTGFATGVIGTAATLGVTAGNHVLYTSAADTPTTTGSASTTTAVTVASATGLQVGLIVSGNGIIPGTYITAISGTALTLSQAVNIANATVITHYDMITAQTSVSYNTLKLTGGGPSIQLASGQTLTLANGGLLVSGVAVAAGALITPATGATGTGITPGSGVDFVIRTDMATDNLTIAVPILANGANALTKSGAGKLTLTAANTFTGNVYINGGTYSFTGQGTGDATIGFGAGTKTVFITNNAILNPTSTSGPSNLKTFSLGAGGGTFSVASGATFTLATAAQLTGAGNLTVAGPGTVVITVADTTFTGNTNVVGGDLEITSANAVGSTAGQVITVSGGILDVRAAIPQSLVLNNSGNGAGALVSLGTGATLTVPVQLASAAAIGGTSNITLSGNITGAYSLTKLGTNTLTLSGTNTYTGGTTVSAGTVVFNSAAALPTAGSLGGSLLISGGTAVLNNFSTAQMAATLSNTLPYSTGVLALLGTSAGADTNFSALPNLYLGASGTVTYTGNYTPPTAGVAHIGGFGGTLIFNPALSGSNSVVISGNGGGIVSLSNNSSTYTGGTSLILSALLQVSSAPTTVGSPGAITSSPFGTGAITIGQSNTDRTGILLTTSANMTIANAITFNTALGSTFATGVGISIGTTGNTFSGTINGAVNGNPALANATFSTAGTGAATISGQITGSQGLTLDGTQGTSLTITLANTGTANNYAGDTNIGANMATANAITLKMGAANQIPSGAGAGNVILTAISGGTATFNMGGFPQQINGLIATGAGTAIVEGGTSGTPTLTIGTTSNTGGFFTATFNGVIQNSGSTLSLTKLGSISTQTLAGANTYTGLTTVSAGQLAVTGSLASTSSLSVAPSTGSAAFAFLPATPATQAFSTLTLASGGTINLNYSGSTVSQIASTNAATTSGTINIGLSGTSISNGTYTLLSAPGGLNTASYNIFNPTNFTFTTSVSPTQVQITVTGQVAALGTAFWKGGLSGNPGVWAASDGTANSNWTSDGTTATPLVPGSAATVTFSATGGTNQTGMTLGANMAVAGVTFSSSASVANDANVLTIGTSGITVSTSTTTVVTLNNNIALSSAQTWTNNSTAANSLTIGGSVNTAGFVLSVTGTSTTTNFAGSITGTGGLTKLAAGTVTLTGASSYTGTTTIDQGVLQFAGNQVLAGGLTFGAAAGSATAGTLNLGTNAVNATFGGAAIVQTNTTMVNSITIASGKTLTLMGGLTVGYSATAGTANQTLLTVSGLTSGVGALVVNGPSLTVGVDITGAANSAWTNTGTLNVSTLASFTANVANINIGVGNIAAPHGILTLSNTANFLQTGSLIVGQTGANNGSGTSTMTFGTGTNVVRADTVIIGNGKSTGPGVVNFASQTAGSPGTVVWTSSTGGPSNIMVGSNTVAGTGGSSVGTLNLYGHSATVTAGAVGISIENVVGATLAGTTGTVDFDTGTFTATTLTIGSFANTSSAANTAVTGTLNIGSSAASTGAFTVSGVTTIATSTNNPAIASNTVGNLNLLGGSLTLGSIVAASKTGGNNAGAATANINVSGGVLTVVPGSTFTLGTQANAGTAVATLNITGSGNVVSNCDILSGGGASTSTIVLNGTTALLDMKGHNIGTAAFPISTLTFAAGTLQNVAEINGGAAFTKTTTGTLVIAGTNSYTGATTIAAGTLTINANNANATGTITATGGRLSGSGTIGGNVQINSGGSILAGNSVSTAFTLTLNNGLAVNSGTFGIEIAGGVVSNGNAGSSTVFATANNPSSNNFYYITNGATSITTPLVAVTIDAGTILSAGNYSYQVASGASGVASGTIPTSGFSFTDSTGLVNTASATLTSDGAGDIYLNFSAAPEPTALLGLAALGFGLASLRRRRVR